MEHTVGHYPTWRKFVTFIGCCVLYLGPYSSELTSGIPYSELLLDPCGKDGSIEFIIDKSSWNNSAGDVPSPYSAATVTTMTSFTTNSTYNDSYVGCGGFGKGASETGM